MMDFHNSTADLAAPGLRGFAILRSSNRPVRRILGGVCLHLGVWPGSRHDKGLTAMAFARGVSVRATDIRTATPDRLSAGI